MKQNYPNSPDTFGFSEFEFPKHDSETALQNDVVFCGKVMIPKTEQNPFLVRSESFRKPKSRNGFSAVRDLRSESLRLPAAKGHSRLRRSDSGWRRLNSLFGVVKFPVQMELSDMKKRQQELNEQRSLSPKLAAEHDGETGTAVGDGKSCWRTWRLVWPLRRKGQSQRFHLLNVAPSSLSFGCLPLTLV